MVMEETPLVSCWYLPHCRERPCRLSRREAELGSQRQAGGSFPRVPGLRSGTAPHNVQELSHCPPPPGPQLDRPVSDGASAPRARRYPRRCLYGAQPGDPGPLGRGAPRESSAPASRPNHLLLRCRATVAGAAFVGKRAQRWCSKPASNGGESSWLTKPPACWPTRDYGPPRASPRPTSCHPQSRGRSSTTLSRRRRRSAFRVPRLFAADQPTLFHVI